MRREYIVNTAYYTGMPFIRNGLAFITLPLLTSYLTPGDYGIVGLVTIVSSFGAFFFCGVGAACNRYYFKYKDSREELNLFFSTAAIFVAAGAVLYAAALLLAHPYLNAFLFRGRVSYAWLLIGFLQVFFNYLAMMNQYVFQNRHEGRRWFVNESVFTGVYVTLSLFLVLALGFRFEALLLAGLAAEILRLLFSYLPLRDLYSPRFSRAMVREALAYSWPQVPAGIIGFSYSYLDRLIMSRAQGIPQVGILDMSARVSSTVKMLLDGVNGVFSPKTVELLKEGTREAAEALAVIGLKVLAAVLCASLAIILFSKELVLLLIKGDFSKVIYVAPLYIYSHVFGALGILAYWLIYYHREKTWLQIPILTVGLVSGTFFNLLLIPKYGLMGAAAAMFITSGIVHTVQFYIGLKCTPIPFDLRKITVLFSGVIAATAALYLLYYARLPWYQEAGIKLAMLAAYAALCFRLGAVSAGDVSDLLGALSGKLKSLSPFGRAPRRI